MANSWEFSKHLFRAPLTEQSPRSQVTGLGTAFVPGGQRGILAFAVTRTENRSALRVRPGFKARP